MRVNRAAAAMLAAVALAAQLGPLARPEIRAVVVSNSVDLEAASEVANFLAAKGAETSLAGPGGIDGEFDLLVIVGGPEAYDGVGELAREYLTQEEISLLSGTPGYGSYFIRFSGGREVVVIAGHTRRETAAAVERFEVLGFRQWLTKPHAISLVTPFGGQSYEVFSRQYSWRYGGKTYSLGMTIPRAMYDYFKSKDHTIPYEDWAVLASDPLSRPTIQSLLRRLNSMADSEGFDEVQRVEFVAAFVQGIPYSLREDAIMPSGEYPRYPIETLADMGGDCEDHAILLATLLMEMGYDVTLVIIWPKPGFRLGHMGVAVALDSGRGLSWEINGTTYWYIDATAPGYFLGEPLLPEALDYDHPWFLPPKLISVPVPVLVRGDTGVVWDLNHSVAHVSVILANLGQAEADLTVEAAASPGGGRVLHGAECKVRVPPRTVVVITLTIPSETMMGVTLRVSQGGATVDRLESLPILGEMWISG